MRKVTNLMMTLFLVTSITTFAQDKYGADKNKCIQNLNFFRDYVSKKDFDGAYEPWSWVLENCPKASKTIYSRGLKIANHRYKKATGAAKETESALIDKIYTMRLEHFPDNLGKVYSDWASSLRERGKSDGEVFAKLDAGFKADPAGMSVKNLAKYFQAVKNKYKDSNVQKVFDTYDDVVEGVALKIDKLTQESDKIMAKDSTGATWTKKEKIKIKNNGINLRALGQVEGALDQILGEVATCDRLIPLYNKNFEANKNDSKWLRRAASRLNEKDCTDDPIFPKLVEAYVHAEPSADAFIYYAKVLEDRGKTAEATKYRKKAVDLETDPYKKANMLYKIAKTYTRRSPSTAASYARKALKYQPRMGRAYLLIARAYAKSANNCGTDEFSKKMVFVAAANKALMAKKVDPSLSSTASRAYKSYMANAPSKKLVFKLMKKSGQAHKIGCWIGETVRIP